MGEIFSRPVPLVTFPFTGERLTSAATGEVEFEHYHRYLYARELCRGKDVLDVACGEGYGSALLAQVANSVLGVDIAEDVVEHARRSYCATNLRFLCGDARRMKVQAGSADVVVSFETLEHFGEQEAFLGEVRRVLRPDGLLIVSTPDRDNYLAANPYHARELTQREFVSLLSNYFAHVNLLVQHPIAGSVLEPSDNAGSGMFPLCFKRAGAETFELTRGIARPRYSVAFASATEWGPLPPSFYFDDRAALSNEQETLLRQELASCQQALASCQQALAVNEQTIDSIYASGSWHVTRPLRAAKRLLARTFE